MTGQVRGARRSTTATSGRAPTRTGGPQKPAPDVTWSWVFPNRDSPCTAGWSSRMA